jgi:hypothetical protein
MEDKETSGRRLGRREFGGVVAAGVALPTLAGAQNALPAEAQPRQADVMPPRGRRLVPDEPPFDANLQFALNPIPLAAEPFPMTAVRLLPNSVFHDAQEWNRSYMTRLDADRMLYTFRVNAGLPTRDAKPLGGWEQPENGQRSSELRGHFPGHFLSASALLWPPPETRPPRTRPTTWWPRWPSARRNSEAST